MKLALNGATVMHSPIEDDVEIAAECGFGALEIWADKLPAHGDGRALEALGARMTTLGLTPWCINSIEDITHRDAAGRAELLDELRRVVSVARAVSAPAIIVVPGRRPQRPQPGRFAARRRGRAARDV